MSRNVRSVLALALAVLVLGSALAPHTHESRLGRHACLACALASADEARSETPATEPEKVSLTPPVELAQGSPLSGAPLGAVPGQSPPDA
jgi:hypothetical protein